jgi:hypothetical protein
VKAYIYFIVTHTHESEHTMSKQTYVFNIENDQTGFHVEVFRIIAGSEQGINQLQKMATAHETTIQKAHTFANEYITERHAYDKALPILEAKKEAAQKRLEAAYGAYRTARTDKAWNRYERAQEAAHRLNTSQEVAA